MNNFRDYRMYMFKCKKREQVTFLINLILFIIAMYSVIQEWYKLVAEFKIELAYILLIIGSILNFLWSLYGILQEIKQQSTLKYGVLCKESIELSQVEPSSTEVERGFVRVACGNEIACEMDENRKCSKQHNSKVDYVMHSKQLDEYLVNNKQLRIEEQAVMEEKIKRFIKSNKERLLPFLTWQYRISRFYGKHFFNQTKLCLSEDISRGSDTVYCHKGGYYDTFLTNQICGKLLHSTQDDTVIVDATSDFPIEREGGKNCLLEITKSEMNNEIGISTIGITSDYYIIFWKQNVQAQSSEGLLVPTGSGSCDWTDLTGNGDFHKTITGAMQRELCEESMGDKKYLEIGDTYLLGFFRWTIKGGKPEFVGVTKMKNSYNEIQANKKEVYKGKEIKVDSKEKLIECIDELFNEKLSTPLYMNLLCLKNCLESDNEEYKKIQKILFS